MNCGGKSQHSQFAYNYLDPASEDGPWSSDTLSFTYVNHRRTALSLQLPAGSWSQTYSYDTSGRMSAVGVGGGTFNYVYPAGQATRLPSAVLLPGGSFITNAYDSVARLTGTQLRSSFGTVLNAHSYAYNNGHQRTAMTNWSNNAWDFNYDGAGQLFTAKGREPDGTPRPHEQFGYKYDAAGNLNTRTNNKLTNVFTVDSLNQLSNLTRSGTLTVAGFTTMNPTNVTVNSSNATRYADGTFARTNVALSDGTNTFTAIATWPTNRLGTNTVSVWLPTNTAFASDGNGNLTSDGRRSYEFDDENQLVRITESNGWKSEFVYDGLLRRRIRREAYWTNSAWVTNVEVRYIYDGRLVLQERNVKGSIPLIDTVQCPE